MDLQQIVGGVGVGAFIGMHFLPKGSTARAIAALITIGCGVLVLGLMLFR